MYVPRILSKVSWKLFLWENWFKYFLKYFLFFYLFIFRENEGEKHQYVVASHMAHTKDLACNPDMWPDWESNWQPFGLQACAQSAELHQPGLNIFLSTLNFSWILSHSKDCLLYTSDAADDQSRV